MNDTGITTCSNDTQNSLPCPVAGFPGQHVVGRDVEYPDNKDGVAGFSFTKLDENGVALDAKATHWSCIRDEVTGLIWEANTSTSGLHNKLSTYSWYMPDAKRNGGNAGTRNGGKCQGSDCDTYSYVTAVNQQGLCGIKSWRLPTMDELIGIVNYGVTHTTVVEDYFPETQAKAYWTAEPVSKMPFMAWVVYFELGLSDVESKADAIYIRLVSNTQGRK